MKNRKHMSRAFSFLLIAVMLFTLAACGKAEDTKNKTEQGNSQQVAEATDGRDENAASDNAPDSSDAKILIAYFTAAENSGVDAIASASYTTIGGNAVGRVRAVADMIQAQTGGELFSIQTANIYPADGGELIDQAADEQDEDFRPELTSHIENLNDYDVIFVGYPNWLAYHNLIQCTQA